MQMRKKQGGGGEKRWRKVSGGVKRRRRRNEQICRTRADYSGTWRRVNAEKNGRKNEKRALFSTRVLVCELERGKLTSDWTEENSFFASSWQRDEEPGGTRIKIIQTLLFWPLSGCGWKQQSCSVRHKKTHYVFVSDPVVLQGKSDSRLSGFVSITPRNVNKPEYYIKKW